jgi:hypothetical protein
MLIRGGFRRLSLGLALTSAMLFATSAYGQTPAGAQSVNLDNKVAPAPIRLPDNPENKVTATASTGAKDLENEVAAVKAENAALREQLRKIEEQQKAVLEMLTRFQARLDAPTIGSESARSQQAGAVPGLPTVAGEAALASVPSTGLPLTPLPATTTPSNSVPPATAAQVDPKTERYQDGMIIWQTAGDAKIPFLLKFNVNTQVRYLNTTSTEETFTDHLGVVRAVHERNDITVNRTMFILGGYVFNPKLRYSFTVWTSAGAASIVIAGNIGWSFNKALTVTGGYTGVPGSRSLVNTFPFFAGTDRSMSDNFFRPGFTQGLWATGDLGKGVNYLVFLGNGLNTLSVSAAKIDPHLLVGGSVWWEPLGAYAEPGKSRNMYDDYFASSKARIRIGTSFTRSREDRFSNVEQSNPDNTSLYNSDGVLSFSTGAFAPGVTLQKATYRMWAIDGGFKWNGLGINGQYYMRWLNDFEADGPLPISSTYDHGFELSVGHFFIPRKLNVYGRAGKVWGQFANPYEYAGGAKWFPLATERFWLSAEVMRVYKSPYSGAFTPYTNGLNGWVPMIQSVLAF